MLVGYPHRAKLLSVKLYKAGGRIVYQDAVDALQDAEEVSGSLNVNTGVFCRCNVMYRYYKLPKKETVTLNCTLY